MLTNGFWACGTPQVGDVLLWPIRTGRTRKIIILPAENRQNVEEDLTPELTEGVAIHYASRIEDVLAVALPLMNARPDARPAVQQAEVVVGSVA